MPWCGDEATVTELLLPPQKRLFSYNSMPHTGLFSLHHNTFTPIRHFALVRTLPDHSHMMSVDPAAHVILKSALIWSVLCPDQPSVIPVESGRVRFSASH